jgi:hypothetical protein
MRRLLNELPSIWSIHLDLRILQPTVNGSQDQAVSNWQPRFSAKSQIRSWQLNSATSKSGQEIKATVAEPIYNPDHSIAPRGCHDRCCHLGQASPPLRPHRALYFDFPNSSSPTTHKTSRHSLQGPTLLPVRSLALDSVTATMATAFAKMSVPATASG